MEYLQFSHLIGFVEKYKNKIPKDAKIYIERVEDIYFDKHGWKPIKLENDNWADRAFPDQSSENEKGDWIEAYDIFYNAEENAVKITPHY